MNLTPLEYDAFIRTLGVGLFSAFFCLIPGIAFATLTARRNFPGRGVLHSLFQLPLVLPPTVSGFLLLWAMGKKGILGFWLNQTFGLTFAFNFKGLILATSVVAFPMMYSSVFQALEKVDEKLEEAARSLGSSPLRVYFTITLPLCRRGILGGLLLTFSKSIGEFGASIVFAANIPGETQTLSMAIFNCLQIPGGESGAMKLALLSVVLSFLAVLAHNAVQSGPEWE